MLREEKQTEELMTVRSYAKSRGRPYDTCKKVASRNKIGKVVTLYHGGKERQLNSADIEEMDRRWRA